MTEAAGPEIRQDRSPFRDGTSRLGATNQAWEHTRRVGHHRGHVGRSAPYASGVVDTRSG